MWAATSKQEQDSEALNSMQGRGTGCVVRVGPSAGERRAKQRDQVIEMQKKGAEWGAQSERLANYASPAARPEKTSAQLHLQELEKSNRSSSPAAS